VASFPERGTGVGGAAILPHDRARQRLAAQLVPRHRRFALVGDADRGDPSHIANLRHNVARAGQRALPYLGGVMLDPTRLRIILRDLSLLRGEHRAAGGIKQGPHRRRPRVEHQQQRLVAHSSRTEEMVA
jgi:hypothetical protein